MMAVINNKTLHTFLNRFPENDIKEISLIYKTMRTISQELLKLKKSSYNSSEKPKLPSDDEVKQRIENEKTEFENTKSNIGERFESGMRSLQSGPTIGSETQKTWPTYAALDHNANLDFTKYQHSFAIASRLQAADERFESSARFLAPYFAGHFGDPEKVYKAMRVGSLPLGRATPELESKAESRPTLYRLVRGHPDSSDATKLITEDDPKFDEKHTNIKYYMHFPRIIDGTPVNPTDETLSAKAEFEQSIKNFGSTPAGAFRNRYSSLFEDKTGEQIPIDDKDYDLLRHHLFLSADGFLWKHYVSVHPLTHLINFFSGVVPHLSLDENSHAYIESLCDVMRNKIAEDYSSASNNEHFKKAIQAHMLESLDQARNGQVGTSSTIAMPSIRIFHFNKTEPSDSWAHIWAEYTDPFSPERTKRIPIDFFKFANIFNDANNDRGSTWLNPFTHQLYDYHDKFPQLLQVLTSPKNQAAFFGNLKFDTHKYDADRIAQQKAIDEQTIKQAQDFFEKSSVKNAEQILDIKKLPYGIKGLNKLIKKWGENSDSLHDFWRKNFAGLNEATKQNLQKTIRNLQVQSDYRQIKTATDEEIMSRPNIKIHPILDHVALNSPDINDRYPSLFTNNTDSESVDERHLAHQDLYLRLLVLSATGGDDSSRQAAYLDAIKENDFTERINKLKQLLPNGESAPWNAVSGPFMDIHNSPSLIVSPQFEHFLKSIEPHFYNSSIAKQPFISFNTIKGIVGGINIKKYNIIRHALLGIFDTIVNNRTKTTISREQGRASRGMSRPIKINNADLQFLQWAMKQYPDEDRQASFVAPFRENIPESHIQNSLHVLKDEAAALFRDLMEGADRRVQVLNSAVTPTVTQEMNPRNRVLASSKRRVSFVNTSNTSPLSPQVGPFGVTYRPSSSGNGVMIPEFRMIYKRINPITNKWELVMPSKPSDVDSTWKPWQNTTETISMPPFTPPAPPQEPDQLQPMPQGITIRGLAGLGSLIGVDNTAAVDNTPTEPKDDDENFSMFPDFNSEDSEGIISGPIHDAHKEYLKLRKLFFTALFQKNVSALTRFFPDIIEQHSLGSTPTVAPSSSPRLGMRRRGPVSTSDPGLVPL